MFDTPREKNNYILPWFIDENGSSQVEVTKTIFEATKFDFIPCKYR